MAQLPLFDMPTVGVVNVAKVSHLSPFRYPGGKTWFVPTARRWLQSLDESPVHFIEPFAGGGIIGLTVAFERLAHQVTLVECDEEIAAVWQVIIVDGDGEWLGKRIVEFELTQKNIQQLLDKPNKSRRELALQTIIRNRVNRGGILAKGAGMVKSGENGRGITSRWYPQTLQKRIRAIDAHRQSLSFVYGDGLHIIEQHSDHPNTAFFIDPPYTATGKKPGARLYNHAMLDHNKLFQYMADVRGNFIMTYNHDAGVIDLAERYGFVYRAVAMKNTHHAKKQELIISNDLSWLAAMPK